MKLRHQGFQVGRNMRVDQPILGSRLCARVCSTKQKGLFTWTVRIVVFGAITAALQHVGHHHVHPCIEKRVRSRKRARKLRSDQK